MSGRICPACEGRGFSGRACSTCGYDRDKTQGFLRDLFAPPNCPTCGFVMCEGFDEERINEFATRATPNGEFSCRSGRCEETGAVVDCTVCGQRKAPRGRSVAPEMANSTCSWDCPGYDRDPKVNDLWPGEKRWQFGYPKVPPYRPPGEPGEGG